MSPLTPATAGGVPTLRPVHAPPTLRARVTSRVTSLVVSRVAGLRRAARGGARAAARDDVGGVRDAWDAARADGARHWAAGTALDHLLQDVP